jgi:MFS family permease
VSDQPTFRYDIATDLPRSATIARVFGTRAFTRLWLSQLTASLGDWVGLIAILAIAADISDSSGAAVALVMSARVIPGFFLATVGGVVVDRFDRRKIMVVANVGRAGLLVVLPFVGTLSGLVLVSFLLEICSLLYGPAKDASVPNLVPENRLASANSLGLVAGFGTFPFASMLFALLTMLASWLSGFDAFSGLRLSNETIALWFNAGMFLVSAAIIWRLPLPSNHRRTGSRAVDWTGALRDVADGFRFVKDHRIVRAVIVGMGIGLIGGGAMVPLGPVFAIDVLGGDSATFGFLMTVLGVGAAVGIGTLLTFQNRIPKSAVFAGAAMGTGLSIIAAASIAQIGLAVLLIGLTGAFAGTAYVAGFSLLQEEVSDELRGRTFAALYTVIRLCLLIALTVAPLFADLFGWLSGLAFSDRQISLGGASYTLSGVRLALWFGGMLTFLAGVYAHRSMALAHRALDFEED